MIQDQILPTFLWAEASKTVVYVQNRCPHKILKNMTLKEDFTGVKPEVGHLHIFGFLVYIHVPKDKRTKLEPSGKKGTFVGYNESSKAYKIYIPGSRQIEVSRYLTFEEEMAIRKGRGSETKIDDDREMRSSPPLEVKRDIEEKNEPINPIDPIEQVNAPTDTAVS